MQALTQDKPTKEQILTLLADWIKQRPGLEYCCYGNLSAYRSEMRSITRDRHDAEILLRAVALSSLTRDELIDSFRAFSGRLQLVERNGSWKLDYCTGQYWPTEYRKAACAVLAMALWYNVRLDIPPEGEGKKSPGDLLRRYFKREFGARMQRRWFD